MIGIDAAEVTLIERLCVEGKLPVLQSLREQGCFGVLESDANIFMSSGWPSFYSVSRVPWHGRYFNKMWRQEKMRLEVISDEWLPPNPFWKLLDPDKFRVALIDIPYTINAPKSFNGIYITGWETHESIINACKPPDLWKRLEKEFGPPINPPEFFGEQSAKSLLKLRNDMIKATRQKAQISEALLVRDHWDLFFVVFGTVHRGGHYLWDLTQIETVGLPAETRQILERGLVDIYQACDRVVANLIEKASDDTRILIFALHGMGTNLGWSEYFWEIVSQIQRESNELIPKNGLIYKVKRALPWKLVRQITTRLPDKINNALVPIWSSRMYDWSTTKYFPLPSDYNSNLRINLKGRESKGVVNPGSEYRDLCQSLKEALLSYYDIDTGEPIVKAVLNLDDLAPRSAPYRSLLPDLVIQWSPISAVHSRGVRSERYGEIRWKPGDKLSSGRSGNHKEKGWFVAVGEGIPPATRADGYNILDLVPTVFHWLGAEPGKAFQGKPIPDLC